MSVYDEAAMPSTTRLPAEEKEERKSYSCLYFLVMPSN
jgi:hypothetical protein